MIRRNITLKAICFLILFAGLICLSGCITTKGISDSSLTSVEPYIFEYDGSIDEVTTLIKRALIRESFLFQSGESDKQDGILNTGFKPLSPEERYDVTFASSMLGIRVDEQMGRLSFIFTELENQKTQIELFAVLSVKVSTTNNSLKDAGANIVPQGHPFIMKYKEILKNLSNNMKLVSPIETENPEESTEQEEKPVKRVVFE